MCINLANTFSCDVSVHPGYLCPRNSLCSGLLSISCVVLVILISFVCSVIVCSVMLALGFVFSFRFLTICCQPTDYDSVSNFKVHAFFFFYGLKILGSLIPC